MSQGNPKSTEDYGPTVFIHGKRLYLRGVEKADAPFLARYINDPEVRRFLTSVRPISQDSEDKWIDSLAESKTDVVFAIVLRESDELIGVMGLHSIAYIHGTATTGSWIDKEDHRSKGYGTEAKMLVLEYAFNTLNLRKICSSVYDFNGRSKSCLLKCGYKEEGVLKSQRYKEGRYVDEILMSVFREDFFPVWEKYNEAHP